MNQIYPADRHTGKKRLILVGNKPPRRPRLAEEIDAFDFVLRINRMNHLGITGNRIDGLFLEANDEFKQKYTGGTNRVKIKDAGKLFMRKTWYMRFDTWPQYLNPVQYSGIEIINEAPVIKETGFKRLTSPILLLGHLLHSAWSEHYHIYITCLDVENRALVLNSDPTWAYHSGAGEIEQAYLLRQIKCNNITRLHDD